ncbi:MAG: glutaredoxin family protein [Planctomycetota bacterium]
MTTTGAETQHRIQGWIGTAIMLAASVLAVLIFCDRTGVTVFNLPRIWFASRGIHLLLCGAMFLTAAMLLKSPVPDRLVEREGRPLFKSCRLLTRRECKLCDEALHTLLQFQHALPSIDVVDIDGDPQLMRQFGESIPVIEIDGRVRFRGRIDWRLLQRMIEAAELRSSLHDSDPDLAPRMELDQTPLRRSVDL